jgi:hypothetical protein
VLDLGKSRDRLHVDVTVMNSFLLTRCLVRNMTRRLLIILILITALTMPFLLLGMRSKSLVVSNSHYATLPEDIRENTINAIKPRKEEITPQTVRQLALLNKRLRARSGIPRIDKYINNVPIILSQCLIDHSYSLEI